MNVAMEQDVAHVVIDGNPADRAILTCALASFYIVSAYDDYRRAAAALLKLRPLKASGAIRTILARHHLQPAD